jgi:hypothetical protein
MTRRWACTAAALIASAVLTACGEDEQKAKPAKSGSPAAVDISGAEPVGQESQGSVVQYADCGDWNKGTEAEKRATVVQLRRQLTPQSSKTAESPLDDGRAFELLEKTCTEGVESLRLYKLYVRMQGFAPLND